VQDPLKNNFHRFHLGLPLVIGGTVFIFTLGMDISPLAKNMLGLWICTLFVTTFHYWKKEHPKPIVVSISSMVGFVAFIMLFSSMLNGNVFGMLSWILGGLILCASIFAMNLGHWYLNVHGLPMIHLKRATYVLGAFLTLRLLIDICQFIFSPIIYGGDIMSLYSFLFHLDGFFLIIAIFFGTLFPLISLYFVNETLRLKNTQSATGILYVVLCAVLIGDLVYKYYFIKFGIAL